MAKKALPILTGGLNELTRPDLLDNSQLQVCNNYEVIGDGRLKLRKKAEVFSESLNTKLSEIFSDIISMSEPYYPRQEINTPDNVSHSDDYVMLFFGRVSGDEGFDEDTYELHMLYKYIDENEAEQWNEDIKWDEDDNPTHTLNSLLIESGVTVQEGSDVKYTIGSDRVVVTDGINASFYFNIDFDGNVIVGKLGIPAPTNRASVTQMTQWADELWETDSTSERLSDPGLFQCTYTVVSKYGEESNPAPLSETLDMQFLKLDADGLDTRWIDKITITALSMPSVSDSILDSLKYFKVYMRVIRYSEGKDAKVLEFTEQFQISNKKDEDGNALISGDETGNDYILTITPESGNVVSYENDVAPVAKSSAELSGITMLGNVKTKISFPYEFKYFHKISINNYDNKTFVDAVIKIRLFDDSVNRGIENFIVSDFVSGGGLENRERIRLFDSDLTTPLICLYNGSEFAGQDYLDLYIKIPLLKPSSTQYIYLCWTGANEGGYSGVPTYYQKFEYGKILDIENDESPDENLNGIWDEMRVNSGDILFANMKMAGSDGYSGVGNKANEIHEINDVGSLLPRWVYTPEFIGMELTSGIIKVVKMTQTPITSELRYHFNVFDGLTAVALPDSGVLYYKFNMSDNNQDEVRVFSLHGTDFDNYYVKLDFLSVEDNSSLWTPKFSWGGTTSSDNGDYSFSDLEIPKVSHGLFLFSWEKGASEDNIKVAVYYMSENTGFEFTSDSYARDNGVMFSGLDGGIDKLRIGQGVGAPQTIDGILISDLRFSSDSYFTGDEADKDKYRNIANYMPGFDNMIGYKYSDDSSNNSIEFSETEEIKFRERKNMVKWSSVNNINFPDLNFKQFREPVLAVIPSPSFLQFDYKNTFLIFTRNTISRFILDGSPDGWGGSVSSLIEEKTQYGLLAKDSLVRAGDVIFWLSEVGVVMWDSNGMKLISKNIVDIPLYSTAIGFYNSLRNQYLIQSSPEIVPGGEGLDDDEGGDSDPFPGWIWGDEVIVRLSGHYWGTQEDVDTGAGLAFEIIGDSASEPYSNYILMNWQHIGFPNLPNTLLGLMEVNNPLDEIWSYVQVYPASSTGNNQRWTTCLNYQHYLSLIGAGAITLVSNPEVEPGHEIFSVIRYNIPDVVFTISMTHIQGIIDAVECANGQWFTNGGILEEDYVTLVNPDGFLCGAENIFMIGINDIALLGFWFTHIEFLESAILQGRLRRDEDDIEIERGDVYSYHIDRNIWTKFVDIDIKDSSILTGGVKTDNVNLLLTQNNSINKYPGTNSVSSGLIRTKKMYFEKGVLKRVNLEHSSDSNESVIFRTEMEKYDSTGETIIKKHTMNSVPSKKWKGIPLSKNRGRALTFEVENADNISTIGYDLRVEE